MFSTVPTPTAGFKPRVDIYEAYIDRHPGFARLGGEWEHSRHLFGVTYDYPASHMSYPNCVVPGKEIMTSPIVSHRENLVETANTIYLVKSWSHKQNRGSRETRSLPRNESQA